MKPIEYYIHIPFCIRKCNYCDFLSFSGDENLREQYVDVLCSEIREYAKNDDHMLSTVFIGGGTPSILSIGQCEKIMEAIRTHRQIDPSAEITMEANPGTLTEEKLRALYDMGINRLSLGLQSMNDEELRNLGRIHTVREFYQNFDAARRSGFDNINIDLMSALPGQTVEKWIDTLQKTVLLNPEHISAYSLIIEEGTQFYERFWQDEEKKEAGEEPVFLPGEEAERTMYHETARILADHGYQRYEISNYAKEGRACRHNVGYWKRAEYYGFGIGAASLIGNRRFQNTASIQEYLSGSRIHGEEILSKEDEISETVFLGLRMTEGISICEVEEKYRISFSELFGSQIKRFSGEGLLTLQNGRLFLTEKGLDLSNYVMAEFLL